MEAGSGAVAMMRSLKQALGPKNIMNPGNIFSYESMRQKVSRHDSAVHPPATIW